jgi:thymidylate synthase (FAD)
MSNICKGLQALSELEGIPKEDSAMLLPLGMETEIVCKHNFRNIMDMSHQRECARAYWEYRELFAELKKALSDYSEQWKYLVDNYLKPKCEILGKCTETHGCGKQF